MKLTRVDFIGFPVDNVGLPELLDFVEQSIKEDSSHLIAVQNANKMYLSTKHPVLRGAINSASIILPENAINMGMRLLGKPLKQRNMGGVCVMEHLLKLANEKAYSIYLLGAMQNNLETLVDRIKADYPGIVVTGFRNGYFQQDQETTVASEIGKLKPNFLFVGMGSPKQELFMTAYSHMLSANIKLGVGGSFNVIAGLEKPAPYWTKYGLEWLYRSIHDPQKLKRYLRINSFFLYRLLRYLTLRKA